MTANTIAHLCKQHDAMLQTMQRMRLAMLAGDITSARAARDALHALQAEHIAAEESDLIPRLGASARWSARVYLAEHTKLAAMTEEWRARLARLPAHIVEPERRLALLDASLPLQHLLEHHFEREEKGLFVEIAG